MPDRSDGIVCWAWARQQMTVAVVDGWLNDDDAQFEAVHESKQLTDSDYSFKF
jgi:hypothetical protein